MQDKMNSATVCPKCGKEYTGKPALSRLDNATLICPDCGILEALSSIGISADEQQKILENIHRCSPDAKKRGE